MTPFEQWSLIAYFSQLGAILWGLWLMREAGQRRDKQLDILIEGLREQSAGIRTAVQGVEKLLERG